MTGVVDPDGRAFLPVRLRHPTTGVETVLAAWVDTACTGELVIPQVQIATLGLPQATGVRVRLADGSEIDLDSFSCLLEWFGQWRPIEVIAGAGQFLLLGVALLRGHRLVVDYGTNVVDLT